MNYKIEYKNGSMSKWNYKNGVLDTCFYDADGYYNASKSKQYDINDYDLQSNLDGLERLGCSIHKAY